MNLPRTIRSAAAAALLCFTMLLSGCGARASAAEVTVPVFPPLPEKGEVRVAVASDLHFDPDNRPHGEEPAQAAYNMELADALLRDAREQGADFLLLTGDLCNGGRDYRHAALCEKLRRAEAAGLPVYVLPGNHDLAPVTQTAFAALYADFGYDEAFSRDPSSLSYCVVRDGLMLLMMDTAGYETGCIDLPAAEAPDTGRIFFSENTLLWAENMLRTAREQGLHILAAGHYNLLPEASRDPASESYYLQNGERFAALLREYGAPLYLSGHMHVRAVYQEAGLTELLTEYLLGYPTAYSVLDLSDAGIVYTPRRVDVDAWAAESGQEDSHLLHFAEWQQEELWRYSEQNVEYMSARNPISRREKADAAAFFYRVMDDYWRGTLADERDAVKVMPGAGPFFRCAEGYAYGWWLRDLIDTASPLLKGFTIPWK